MERRPDNRPVALTVLAGLVDGHIADADTARVTVQGVSVDSRSVQPGDLFVALPGEHAHGASFSAEAFRRGAVAALTDSTGAVAAQSAGLTVVVVSDPRARVGAVAAEVYGHPAKQLLTFGVTGTNGKTTTTWLLDAGLRAAGHVTGLVGTVETRIAGRLVPSVRTTPEAAELQALLALMVESGVTAVALEVSSHALQLGRVDGVVFDVAGFTQFGSDHLDFHASVEEYFAAKARLFTPELSRRAVVCVDDEGGQRMAAQSSIPTQTLSTTVQPAQWQALDVEPLVGGGSGFSLVDPEGRARPVRTRLPGRFNVANASLALVMLHVAGVAEEAAEGVAECVGVPGRMETASAGQEFVALVDYAHTPDALASVLSALIVEAEERQGRVIVVFGCGGDRDASKRESMGEVAAELANVVIVTDDNPRSEDPSKIRRQVLVGAERAASVADVDIREVADRAAAISLAVGLARPADIVVVAGKGHESGQERGGVVAPFDDREVLLGKLRDLAASRNEPTAEQESR